MTRFATSLGMTQARIAGGIARNSFSTEVLSKIIEVYSNISAEWLMIGRGEMFRSAENLEETLSQTREQLAKKELELELAQKQIGILIDKLATSGWQNHVVGGVVNPGSTTIINKEDNQQD